jgi:hypothetical protein
MTAREKPGARADLPREAYALVGDPERPGTWQLPHHRVSQTTRKRPDPEATVDWESMPEAVAALSPIGHLRRRIEASPEDILRAAGHLAQHYRKAGRPLPDTLAALL